MLRNPLFNQPDQSVRRRQLRAASPAAERLLWRHIRGEACGVKFRRQFSVRPFDSDTAFFLDFYCPVLRLAIEIDGTSHQTDEAAAYDKARQESIEALGISFVRFSNDQIFRCMPDVMETLLGKIAELKAANEGRDV